MTRRKPIPKDFTSAARPDDRDEKLNIDTGDGLPGMTPVNLDEVVESIDSSGQRKLSRRRGRPRIHPKGAARVRKRNALKPHPAEDLGARERDIEYHDERYEKYQREVYEPGLDAYDLGWHSQDPNFDRELYEFHHDPAPGKGKGIGKVTDRELGNYAVPISTTGLRWQMVEKYGEAFLLYRIAPCPVCNHLECAQKTSRRYAYDAQLSTKPTPWGARYRYTSAQLRKLVDNRGVTFHCLGRRLGWTEDQANHYSARGAALSPAERDVILSLPIRDHDQQEALLVRWHEARRRYARPITEDDRELAFAGKRRLPNKTNRQLWDENKERLISGEFESAEGVNLPKMTPLEQAYESMRHCVVYRERMRLAGRRFEGEHKAREPKPPKTSKNWEKQEARWAQKLEAWKRRDALYYRIRRMTEEELRALWQRPANV